MNWRRSMEINIEKWIDDSPKNLQLSRQAVHVILKAISGDSDLRAGMIIKGGTLLGIRYGSDRYTTDIDFSTGKKLSDINLDNFEDSFNEALDVSEATLNYGLKCQVQSYKIQPNPQGTFPTIKIKIAYCMRTNESHMRRLKEKNAPLVISIDYSFNEQSYNTEILELGDDSDGIKAYGICDLLAEKIRSVLQQVARERNREQDIYDINFLLTTIGDFSNDEKYKILDSLLHKSEGRDIDEFLNKDGILDPEIKRRSGERYLDLKDTVNELPDFEESYKKIVDFFQSLPWELFGK
jgi:predicted nucleotidyltransferase component of viral defense system